MIKKEQLAAANAMAKASIYDGAKYIGEWNGYAVYDPVFNDDEPHFIGIPQYILIKGSEARWTESDKESFAIMDSL